MDLLKKRIFGRSLILSNSFDGTMIVEDVGGRVKQFSSTMFPECITPDGIIS
jgi:hypothetical protein